MIRIGESFEYLSHLQKIWTFKRFDSNFFMNLLNVLNILLASLFLQKIQIFETFNSGESFHNSERFNSGEFLVNFSHLEKIHTFKKFCSGEYLSHLQKIQFFGRFDCGHLLNISHICKDSDIQKIPLPENTILSLGQNLNIIFPLHATSLHPHFVCLTSSHFVPLHLASHFVCLTS